MSTTYTPAISLCAVLVITSLYMANQEVSQTVDSTVRIIPDNSSIPFVDYGYHAETYIGRQRNPVSIAHSALEHHESYNRSHDNVYLQKFLNNSDWLVENTVSHGNYSLFEYQFPWPRYDLLPPWHSGMAQALALEALIKAYDVTNDKRYLNTSKQLLNAFFIEVKDGGVTYKTPNDGWWYEEYAKPGAIESRVLNGHTFALLGIHKYYEYTQDPVAKYLFNQGILTLKKNLPSYEFTLGGGQYSTYDILNNEVAAPIFYHIAQTSHLGQLYEITGEEIFKTYHDKWTYFSLPEGIAQALGTYHDPKKIQLSLVTADEDFVPVEESRLKIQNTENSSGNGNMPAKFRIEGDGGNKTAQFTASQRFNYIGKNISVTLGDQIKSFTNLNISFVVIREGHSEKNNVIFLHRPITDGWNDEINYFIGIGSNSSKSVSVRDLFGHADEYMIIRQIGIEVPENACVNSMEFEVEFN
ncbi:MAG: hypothetical protein GEU26_12175 [Nitrososphaeraceae archaeon]|nr:hypothetical protein [Nitrososphaeraceae archaeon]